MSQRSRKRRNAGAAPPPVPAPNGSRPTRAQRTEARNDQLRAELAPLQPGQRPLAVTIAAVLAGLLAVGNLIAYLAGAEVDGQRAGPVGVLLFVALMVSAAVGMWRLRYWAVLGFEALLGVSLAVAGLSLAVASNLQAVVLCLAVLGLGGWLFWKLVRVMARIQLPDRPGRDRAGGVG